MIVYVPPRGPVKHVCPPLDRGAAAGAAEAKDWRCVDMPLDGEVLPCGAVAWSRWPEAARRHSRRLLAGSIALQASSRIEGVWAAAEPAAAAAMAMTAPSSQSLMAGFIYWQPAAVQILEYERPWLSTPRWKVAPPTFCDVPLHEAPLDAVPWWKVVFPAFLALWLQEVPVCVFVP